MFLTRQPRGANWMPLAPDSSRVVVRQTFLQRSKEVAAVIHLERIGASTQVRPPLSAQQVGGDVQCCRRQGVGRTTTSNGIRLPRCPWWRPHQHAHLHVHGEPQQCIAAPSPPPSAMAGAQPEALRAVGQVVCKQHLPPLTPARPFPLPFPCHPIRPRGCRWCRGWRAPPCLCLAASTSSSSGAMPLRAGPTSCSRWSAMPT